MPANGHTYASSELCQTLLSCHTCVLNRQCLTSGLNAADMQQLDSIVRRHRPLHKGEYLFRAGDVMHNLYAVRSGAVKTCFLDADGNEQISGLHLPGELVGLEALGIGAYYGDAIALETTMVCSLPLQPLEELAGRLPTLRKQLLRATSRELHYEQQHFSHCREAAEQRLTSFLLNLSVRFSKRGLSATYFRLPMSRGDVANYLGLTIETVSRLLSRYRQLGLIEFYGREIHLLDRPALCLLSGAQAFQRSNGNSGTSLAPLHLVPVALGPGAMDAKPSR